MTILIPADAAIAIRGCIALVFLAAALGKMRHWAEFHGVVANYRLLPERLIVPVAYGLPPLELVLGAVLLGGVGVPWAAGAGALLLLIFAAAMGANIRRGRRHIDCGCFQSALKQPLRWWLVVRNGVLAALLAAIAVEPHGAADVWITVNGIFAGAAAFVVLQSWNALWAVRPARRRPVDAQAMLRAAAAEGGR